MSELNIIEIITKLNLESQNQKLRLLAKVDVEAKLKIIQDQKPIFHKLKNDYSDVDNAVLTLSSIILSIDKFSNNHNKVNFDVMKLRAKNNKSKVKRQKILGYWAIVRTLKLEENMSFRDISAYFKKYHKLEVSYSTIFQLWNEIENYNIKKEENNG